MTPSIEVIFAQIDAVGGISASWVLVVLAGISGALIWGQLNDIKKTLSEISKLVQLHDKDIAVLKAKQEEE